MLKLRLYLGSGNFDHGLGSRMLNSDFSEDRISVIGHHNAAHRVHQHLEHGLRPEAGSDDIADSFARIDVLCLDSFSSCAFCVLAQDQDGTRGIAEHLMDK